MIVQIYKHHNYQIKLLVKKNNLIKFKRYKIKLKINYQWKNCYNNQNN